jgi:radical SAM superfamily enzyme YgiQ (UPF0313 family)
MTTKLLVYLADLRYNYQGTLPTDAMPLGIGFIKAVLDKELGEQVESILFATPDILEAAINERMPDALFLSNYVWNERLGLHFARHVKQLNANCFTVMGGPNISLDDEKKIAFLKAHPEIDLYATGEGDFWAAEVLKLYFNEDRNITRLLRHTIHSAAYLQTDHGYVVTPVQPRSRNLDEIPSPFLTGVMDKFFTGKFAPLLETNRGCPFTCTFCVQGTGFYKKVNYFSLERVKEEIEYIGQKIHTLCPEQKVLRIADPNYGMYERDVTISEYIGAGQKKYKWPLLIDATTGKNKADRIIQSLEKLGGALAMYQAVQSLDDEVLQNIERQNISLDAYEKIQVHVRGRGLRSSSDIILALPGESLQSHFTSLKKLINAGTHKLNSFQGMMLKGSEMETETHRQKFALQTKYRLLAKNFGEYFGEKVFDVEEIIVGNDKMNFDDYLKARFYHLGIAVFWNASRFENLVKACNKLGISNWEWLEFVISKMDAGYPELSKLWQGFLQETKEELFDSPEAAKAFYSKPGNFGRLMQNDIGDNLIYKYRSISNLLLWEQICDFVFEFTGQLISGRIVADDEFYTFFENLKQYTKASFASGLTSSQLLEGIEIVAQYDIGGWLKTCDFAQAHKYKLNEPHRLPFTLQEENRENIEGALKVWTFDTRALSMLIRRMHPDWLMRQHPELHVNETQLAESNQQLL